MNIDSLFGALAEYLDFIINLALLRGMDEYLNLGHVSPKLVAFAVVGVSIAYLISYSQKVPRYGAPVEITRAATDAPQEETVTQDKENEKDKSKDLIKSPEIALFLIYTILSGFLFHGFLILYNLTFQLAVHSVNDSLNAVFAYNALINPIISILNKIQKLLEKLKYKNWKTMMFAGISNIIIGLIYIGSAIYWAYPFAAVHGESIKNMLWLTIGFGVIIFVLIFLFFLTLGISQKIPSSQNKKA